MRIAYFDEVKYDSKQGQNYFWLCALIATPEQIWRLETKINVLSEKYFGIPTPNCENEIHASAIIAKHSKFKLWGLDKRIQILKDMIDILDSEADLRKIVIKIDPNLIVSSKPSATEDWGFIHLMERIEMELKSLNSPGIMIGDLESTKSSKNFADALANSRHSGTKGPFGIPLKCLLDTVHFTSSHYSRMLQLADFHSWLRQASCRTIYSRGDSIRSIVLNYANTKENALRFHRFKPWPTESTWYS